MGQEAAFKKATKDEVAITSKLDQEKTIPRACQGRRAWQWSKGSKALIAPRGWGHGSVAGDGRRRGLELALILQASAPLRTGAFSGKWKIVCLLTMTLSNLESCDEKVNSLLIYFNF